jgi:two-component system CheB/CheR fusion protein
MISDTRHVESGPPESDYPIVAIGSSAGGLPALIAFFEASTGESEACFLVAGHFPAGPESHLVEILHSHTRLPIRNASHGTPLEPGAVLVVPPGTLAECRDGHLELQTTPHDHTAPLLVDTLLHSLALVHPERSIAVILSGSGSDGALGARELKDAGGIVLVQTPESARFAGMPDSAILTGAADFVAEPAELAHRVQDLANARWFAIPATPFHPEPAHTASMRRLEVLIKRHAGFNLGDYKQESVSRRIERRMGLCRISEFEQYVGLLQKNPAECENLAKDMLISVTAFFRDPEVFARVRETVLPGLVKESRGRPLRIWVPGCATGEEAYTLAMLLDDTLSECGESGIPYKIFATDLDRRALEIAGQGIYPASALAGVSATFRQRYFNVEGGACHVARQLREHMVFAKHNILKDPPFNRLDLISCRNLLIYLQPHAQHRVLSMIHFALRQSGVLLLGLSETTGDMSEEFGSVDQRQHIFHKKTLSPSVLPETIPIAATRGGSPAHYHSSPSQTSYVEHASNRLVEAFTDRIVSRSDRICFVLNERLEILYSFGKTRRLIDLKSGRASMHLADLLPKNLAAAFSTATARVLAEEKPCRFGPIPMEIGGDSASVTLLVESIRPAKDDRVYFLVLIEEAEPGSDVEENSIGLRESMQRIGELEEELRSSRSRLKSAVEELEASNEELQTSNEELQASNEELQSANEELESVNEELQTLNTDHQFKIQELTKAKEDLDNFISSADIATIFLDPDLHIRRFTPSAARHTGLLPHDIGRAIAALSHPLLVQAAEAARRILAGAEFIESNLPGAGGETIHLRAKPYMSKDGARAGATISLIPITPPLNPGPGPTPAPLPPRG